jgi:hypothetical protein
MIRAAAIATLTVLAGPVLADAAAIAYDPDTGVFGAAWRSSSTDVAKAQATAECAGYGGDCAATLAFADGCGALASGAVGHAARPGSTVASAEAAALAACARVDRGGCAIVVSFCSDR